MQAQETCGKGHWCSPCGSQSFFGIPGNWMLWFCPPWGTHIFFCVCTSSKVNNYKRENRTMQNMRFQETVFLIHMHENLHEYSVMLILLFCWPRNNNNKKGVQFLILFYSHWSSLDTGNVYCSLNNDARFENQSHICVWKDHVTLDQLWPTQTHLGTSQKIWEVDAVNI